MKSLSLTLACFIVPFIGCATARVEVTKPDGTRALYARQALLQKLEVDEASFTRAADGSLDASVKGFRSDSTRALDVAEKALSKLP